MAATGDLFAHAYNLTGSREAIQVAKTFLSGDGIGTAQPYEQGHAWRLMVTMRPEKIGYLKRLQNTHGITFEMDEAHRADAVPAMVAA